LAQRSERYDDQAEKYRISVKVTNARWGPLFGYEGSFDVQWKPVRAQDVPSDVKPLREERRE
jgi:hypothetical protein